MIYSNKKYSHTSHISLKKVTHCIFDLDGTIVDSECVYHETLKELCKKYDKVYKDELKNKLYGATDIEVCEVLVQVLDLKKSPLQLQDELEVMCEKAVLRAPLHKGVLRLLHHLRDHGIPMAIASNATESAIRLHKHAKPQIFGMFHHTVSSTDPEVFRAKPQPDIYLIAASRFPDKPKPVKCLVFEDSIIGARAGAAAGMQVVFTPHRRVDQQEIKHATIVLRSLLHFKPELFGLPPFPKEAERDDYKNHYNCCCSKNRSNKI